MMYKIANGLVGGSDEVAFYSIKPKVGEEELSKLGPKDKKKLGENGVLIQRDKISGLTACKDKKYTTVIHAKGMGDDIGVLASDEDTQNGIVKMIEGLVGRNFKETSKEAGFFVKSGKMVFLSIISAVITGLLFFLVSGVSPEEVDRVGRHAGKEELLYGVANMLGPVGTLLVGGGITALLIFKAYKNHNNGFAIYEYSLSE